MQKAFEALFGAFPDFHYRIDEATEEEDRVVCKVTMTGTHLGPALRDKHGQGDVMSKLPLWQLLIAAGNEAL